MLRKLYVAPFSQDQIKAYVDMYNKLDLESWGNERAGSILTETSNREVYSAVVSKLGQESKINLDDFEKMPGLKDLISTPFLLHLAVQALPAILAEQNASQENQKITQAKLYDVFIEQ